MLDFVGKEVGNGDRNHSLNTIMFIAAGLSIIVSESLLNAKLYSVFIKNKVNHEFIIVFFNLKCKIMQISLNLFDFYLHLILKILVHTDINLFGLSYNIHINK